MTESERPGYGKAALGALWVITVLEAAFMLLAGSAKFVAMDVWTELFVSWGYPARFALLIGATEMVGAVLLLVPRLAAYSALLLGAIMIGAVATVVAHQSPMGVTAALVHLAALTIVAVGRWRSRLRRSGGSYAHPA